jgi:hypothetical protein
MNEIKDDLDRAADWIAAAEEDLGDHCTHDNDSTALAIQIAEARIKLWHAMRQRDYYRAAEAARQAANRVQPPPPPSMGYMGF